VAYIKRLICLLLLSAFALELFFVLRIAAGNVLPIRSTAFERTAIVRLLLAGELKQWHREWRSYDNISENLKRAVVASEDSRFEEHFGVEWEAVWKAWQHNQRVQSARDAGSRGGTIRGGSTITQQLAKNLFLSTEQTYVRKGQELFITLALETLLTKERLLELYLNHAEWGNGIYGAQAAAQTYYKHNANNLNAVQAARLAAMLPRPRYYQNNQGSAYLQRRAGQIMRGMPAVSIP
jgi:monofunctional biosynthetic peptidoglycan transglycosylase